MKYEVKCGKCGELLKGVGYEMSSLSFKHIRDKHPEDKIRLDEAKNTLDNIKNEFKGLWFQYQW